jgi:nucleotide sugar dehydrogenase
MAIYGVSRKEAAKRLKAGQVTIAVYGMGKMGLPLACVFADKGAQVIGVDVSEKIVADLNKGVNHVPEEPGLKEMLARVLKAKRFRATTDAVAAAKESDVQIILIPTLLDRNFKPEMKPLEQLCEKIAGGMRKSSIVISECTMPPGSTEQLIPFLERGGLKCGKDFGLAHAPERTMTGTAIRDIEGQYPKVVGACNHETLDSVCGIYDAINSKGVIPVSSIKAAECVKVFEGVYRDVNIGLANELALYCDRIGVDAIEVFRVANTQPYCHIHTPGPGVGGHCIPVYPYFIMSEHTPITRAARNYNDWMREHIVNLAEQALKEKGKALKGANVFVLGLTFRGGVRAYHYTAAEPVIALLKRKGATVFAFDPLSTEADYKSFGVEKSQDYSKMDCVIILADHAEFRSYDWSAIIKKLRTKAVVDARQTLDPEFARKQGAAIKSIGRI